MQKVVLDFDLIKGDEEEGPTDQKTQTDQPYISLNAIIGSTSTQNMLLHEKLGGQSVWALHGLKKCNTPNQNK